MSVSLSLSLSIYIYIYLFMYARGCHHTRPHRPVARADASQARTPTTNVRQTANLPTNIVDFGGFDSSIILVLRGGILVPTGDFPENMSQAMLVGCNFSRRIGRKTDGQDQHLDVGTWEARSPHTPMVGSIGPHRLQPTYR